MNDVTNGRKRKLNNNNTTKNSSSTWKLNDNSNLNGGPLPDGRVYLVHNPVTPKKKTHGMGLGGDHPSGRDPVTLATSKDGFDFDSVGVAMTCTNLTSVSGGVHTTNCKPRFEGKSKNAGPSYPQALTVVAPAPEEHRGFYVAASNNKEDIWITKLDYSYNIQYHAVL